MTDFGKYVTYMSSLFVGAITVISLMIGLTACEKKEAAPPPVNPHAANAATACMNVTILKITDGYTLMEIDGDAPRNRINRQGTFGDTGDRFRFCE